MRMPHLRFLCAAEPAKESRFSGTQAASLAAAASHLARPTAKPAGKAARAAVKRTGQLGSVCLEGIEVKERIEQSLQFWHPTQDLHHLGA
jgi:hypothetical protein